jgi:hypothetical protein
MIRVSFQSITENFYVLDLLYTLRTKLRAFSQRERETDFQDIVFLITQYPQRISTLRRRLDTNDVADFFESGFFRNLSARQRSRFRGILRR